MSRGLGDVYKRQDQGQREKVKSITFRTGKLCWIWAEEATELLAEDIDTLDDRLRGKLDNKNLYYQLTLSFNPVSAGSRADILTSATPTP